MLTFEIVCKIFFVNFIYLYACVNKVVSFPLFEE